MSMKAVTYMLDKSLIETAGHYRTRRGKEPYGTSIFRRCRHFSYRENVCAGWGSQLNVDRRDMSFFTSQLIWHYRERSTWCQKWLCFTAYCERKKWQHWPRLSSSNSSRIWCAFKIRSTHWSSDTINIQALRSIEERNKSDISPFFKTASPWRDEHPK